MRLLRLSDVQNACRLPNEILCKASWVPPFGGMLIISVFCIAPLWMTYSSKKHIPVSMAIAFGLMWLIFFWLSGMMFFKTFKPTNWILTYSGDEFFIKYRSYQNNKLPAEDIQIISLSRSEVVSVNKTKCKRTSYGLRGRKTEYLTFIDLHLNTTQTDDISQALSQERTKRVKRAHSSGIIQDYPVTLVDRDILRIRFNGVTPSAGKLLERLKGCVNVGDTQKLIEDFTISYKDKRKMEDEIIRLVETGHKLAAINLLRRSQGMTITQAKQFVEDLER